MSSRFSTSLAATLLLTGLVVGTPAAAQNPQVRDGFWIGFGLGYGSANGSCDGCGSSDSESGLTGHLKLGGTLSPKVLLGAESDVWMKEINGATNTVGNFSGTVYFYPSPAGGFFLKGGAGLAYYSVSEGNVSVSKAGLGLMGGAGYDVRVGRNISITPMATFRYAGVGDIEELGVVGASFTVLDLGVGVTFH